MGEDGGSANHDKRKSGFAPDLPVTSDAKTQMKQFLQSFKEKIILNLESYIPLKPPFK